MKIKGSFAQFIVMKWTLAPSGVQSVAIPITFAEDSSTGEKLLLVNERPVGELGKLGKDDVVDLVEAVLSHLALDYRISITEIKRH